VPVYVSALVGFLTSIVSFYAAKYKYLISVDDGLDIFAIHGVGGFFGDILTGFFAAQFVPALDGVSGDSYAGGWWNHHWRQMGLQLAGAVTCASWSFFVSCILLFVINKIPGMHIRASETCEIRGLDFAYITDVDWEGETPGEQYMSTIEGEKPPHGSGSVTNSGKEAPKTD
jgi:ammonium transporter, Amt family